MRTCNWRSIAFSLFLTLTLSSLGYGQLSGPITSDTTWTAVNGATIQDSVTVLNGFTLTIQPGTVVKFNSGGILVVAGTLKANGTSGSPITFTANSSTTPGFWRNLSFLASASVTSYLNYCVFEYGGSGTNGSTIFYFTGAPAINISNTVVQFSAGHGINVRASSPRISTSNVRNNAGYGIYSDLVTTMKVDSTISAKNSLGGIRIPINSNPEVTNSRIDSNGIGIFIDNSSAPKIQNNLIRYNNTGIQFTGLGATQPTIEKNTITNNTTWGFLNTGTGTVIARKNYWGSDFGPFHASLNPTGLGDKVSNNVDFQPWTILALARPVAPKTLGVSTATWYADSVYWVKNDISVSGTLTIRPGTVVKFASGARLTINGTINANGKPDSLIVFTSERDDPYGGDTNGDSTLTIPSRGIWDMVWLYIGGNSSSVLNNCVFRFGGSTGNGNLRVDGTTPIITNITSTQSSNYGLWLVNGANGTVSNSTFSSNSQDGIWIYSSNPSIYGTKSINNGRYGILANTGSPHFTVRKSEFTGNSHGIVADAGAAGATLVSMDSSNVSNNINGGLYLHYGTGPQSFSYNRISNNGTYGLWCYNFDNLVTIVGDTILNNGQEGIVTSKAVINNNIIQGNRYPIALMGRVNSTYSGNTISGNTYNNALALRANRSQESFSDTLKAIFPAGITSGTYVVIDIGGAIAVNAGETLVIQPGVIIKIDPTIYFRVDGTLLADASSGSPIVFTSYRDATYGGKTNLISDNAAPAPGDWRYVRIRTAGANASVLNNVIFKYGGTDGYGNLWLDGTITLSTPIRNVISRKSSNIGIRVGDGQMVFENCTIDSNGTYGMYVEGNRPSDVTVKTSTIQDNGSAGLQGVDNSTFREVSNCIIRRNIGWGIGVVKGTIDQVIQGNTVTFNGAGIYNDSPAITANGLQFIGNTVSDNTGDGILSARARFVDNTIQRNRFPLAIWGRLGNIYTDNNGVDGNVISQNTYNNAIAIWQAGISDTMKASFPQAITSKTYVAIYNFTVDASTTLVIEPGVKIKFQEIPVNNWRTFNVYGTLKAEGTPANPIVFTSWRDSVAGGKTTSLTDYTPPAPGDWYYIIFRNGSNSSVVRHCQFKYGGRDGQQAVYFQQNPGMVFSNNLVRKSMAHGILVYNTAAVIDSTTVDSCAYSGIWVYPIAASNLTLKNSRLLNNGQYGLYVQDPAKLSLLSNCDISRNGLSGVYVENNTVPLSVIGNTIANNANHGLYLKAVNDAQDTLLLIAGNKVRNNGLIGIASSRAHIVDDSVTGNRYAIGVLGQLSLAGTTTANGNVYSGNIISGNTYAGTLVTEEAIYGKLGYSFPPTYSSKVIAVRGTSLVNSGTTLTIAPGSILKFPREYTGGAAGGDGRFRSDGVLLSEGSTTSKIVFTSWKDDSYGGDSNLDSNATVPGNGNWDYIYLNGAGNNTSHILNTIIRFGGLSGIGNIYQVSNSAAIDSSFISYTANYGIYLSSSSPNMTANEIHHTSTGIYGSGSSNPVIYRNNFHDNSAYGFNNGTTNVVNAASNYWGAASGPLVNQGSDQNLTGTGNRIGINSGAVTYRPYLTSRSGILLGDVSENGGISAYDGALVLRHVVNIDTLKPSQQLAADVSADGNITAFDASYILRYVVGLVSGFPGLGKRSSEDLTSAYEFQMRAGGQNDQVELVLRLKGTAKIYSSEIHLTFDKSRLTPISTAKMTLSDDMSVESNFADGSVHIAIAGTTPSETDGDFVRIVFRSSRQFRRLSESSIKITGFLLNEANLTSTLSGDIAGSLNAIPTEFGLEQNYPNPFNPTTTIEYQLPQPSSVSIIIYNVLGQEVRHLVSKDQAAGFYSISWDGKNSGGESVGTGMYLYRIRAAAGGTDFTTVRKMLLLK